MAEKKRDTTVELNVTDMFWQFLCNWKKVLILAIILGLILGGWKLATSLINNHDPDYVQVVRQKNKILQDSYDLQLATYEKQIRTMQAQVQKIEETKENAVMLRMDPYNTYVKTVCFYIDTDYKIMPEMTYQDPNYTISITNGYIDAMRNMNLDKAVASAEEPELTAQNPVINNAYTLMNISELSGDGLIYITIKGDSKECVQRIFEAVNELIEERKPLMVEAIGEHEVTILSETDDIITDSAVTALQDQFVTNNSTLVDNLKAAQNALENLKTPSMVGTSTKSAVIGGIKFGILGGIIGVILGFVIWGLFRSLRGRVNSVEELRQKYDAVMLAASPKASMKRSNLDRKLLHHLGIRKKLDTEKGLDLAAANIRLYLPEATDLLLIGTVGDENLAKIGEDLAEKLPEKKILIGGDVNLSAAAVSAVEEGHTVICVEELNESHYRFINHELETIDKARAQQPYFIVVG